MRHTTTIDSFHGRWMITMNAARAHSASPSTWIKRELGRSQRTRPGWRQFLLPPIDCSVQSRRRSSVFVKIIHPIGERKSLMRWTPAGIPYRKLIDPPLLVLREISAVSHSLQHAR
ncbi:hypothetical protein CLAIMM_10508 [Cladophialophora immunda]|nr:hypothetical protein CLAIMM_10508 [Cladophialophora immunda]